MNILNEIINRSYPGATLSCRECGKTDVKALENNSVGLENPLGERQMTIACNDCGLTDYATKPADVRKTVEAWLVKGKRIYTCHFMFDNELFETKSSGTLGDFSNGFWVTKPELRFTKGSGAAYWVPPGRIVYVSVSTEVERVSE